jgi:acetylornithine/succinyldiaminopimelate/putrescine aminotransferase
LGKALGGGMPLGAFIADKQLMSVLTHDPVLGHITTFGGHPICCAAGMAAFSVLIDKTIASKVNKKEKLFHKLLEHAAIKEVRSAGLLIAVEFPDEEMNKKVISYCVANGVLTDWFLFAPNCLRIAPPLNISTEEIKSACKVITDGIDAVYYS